MSRREDHVGCIDVTDEDRTVSLHQAGAQFVQEIFSAIRDLGVNGSGSVSMAGALGAGKSGFQVAVNALRLDRWQRLIREGAKSSQPQIDAQTRERLRVSLSLAGLNAGVSRGEVG